MLSSATRFDFTNISTGVGFAILLKENASKNACALGFGNTFSTVKSTGVLEEDAKSTTLDTFIFQEEMQFTGPRFSPPKLGLR